MPHARGRETLAFRACEAFAWSIIPGPRSRLDTDATLECQLLGRRRPKTRSETTMAVLRAAK